jgi:hypothetical protein
MTGMADDTGMRLETGWKILPGHQVVSNDWRLGLATDPAWGGA